MINDDVTLVEHNDVYQSEEIIFANDILDWAIALDRVIKNTSMSKEAIAGVQNVMLVMYKKHDKLDPEHPVLSNPPVHKPAK